MSSYFFSLAKTVCSLSSSLCISGSLVSSSFPLGVQSKETIHNTADHSYVLSPRNVNISTEIPSNWVYFDRKKCISIKHNIINN